MRWLQVVGSSKLYVSFAKEPYERDDILHLKADGARQISFVGFTESQMKGSTESQMKFLAEEGKSDLICQICPVRLEISSVTP